MRRAAILWRCGLAAVALLLLGGCLEVEQYPAYRNGAYDGKHDMLAPRALFHGDRLAWNAALVDRNHLQNEYRRTEPPGRRRHEEPQR